MQDRRRHSGAGILRYAGDRRPTYLASADATLFVFRVVRDGRDVGDVSRRYGERVRVDDTKTALIGIDYGANVNTAFAAQQKVSRAQRKSIAL